MNPGSTPSYEKKKKRPYDGSKNSATVAEMRAEIAGLKVGQFKLQAGLSRLGGERDRLGNSLSKIKVKALRTQQPAKKKIKKENGCADNAQKEVIIIDD